MQLKVPIRKTRCEPHKPGIFEISPVSALPAEASLGKLTPHIPLFSDIPGMLEGR